MGYGQDEDWLPEYEEEIDPKDKPVLRFFDYDEDEWLALSYSEKQQKRSVHGLATRGRQ